jgi:uncharacterized protein
MAIQGSLQDISVTSLIQSLIQEKAQAQLEFRSSNQLCRLYLDHGRLCHAVLTDTNGITVHRSGEEAVYDLISWQTGQFIVERNVPPPARDIKTSWEFLLMESLRQMDEKTAFINVAESKDSSELLSGLSESDRAEIQILMKAKEETMASKSEQIQAILTRVVSESSDLTGAVVVSSDGLVMGSVLNSSIDGNRVGAVSAGLLSLANRSAQQLNQGDLLQTLVQASSGNIIAIRSGQNASFVALTPTNVNLGMVFLECRDAAQAIGSIL